MPNRPRSTALVCGLGLQTSVGFSTAANSAAIRGSLNNIKAYDWLPASRDGRPLLLARINTLSPALSPLQRMVRLALDATEECLALLHEFNKAEEIARLHIPMLLSLPPERPQWSTEHNTRLVSKIVNDLSVPIDTKNSGVLNTGHHGVLALLPAATELITNGQASACIVGGVDSYMHIEVLDWLDQQFRLKAPDAPNGFIPGEGAGFVLLGSEQLAKKLNVKPEIAVVRASQAVDETPWHLGTPTLGGGLSSVFQELLTQTGNQADISYGDLNGESWRVDEWSVAYLRTGEYHTDPLNLKHPADSWGDLGAASGGALLALASFEMTRQAEQSPNTALIFTASDTRPFRSGCFLTKRATV